MFKWCNDCQVSIFEINLMVKIGVIFMLFSNPTCHFRDTADFTSSTYSTYGKVSCISEMASRIWKWHENNTYFHHQFYLKNANLTVITPLEHTFIVNGLNSLYCILVTVTWPPFQSAKLESFRVWQDLLIGTGLSNFKWI